MISLESQLVCRETYGSHSDPTDYVRRKGGIITNNGTSNKTFASIAQVFRTVFLPQGYPDSVSKDYLQYQMWDTVQAFCSSMSGTLSTHAMLRGVGVGDETASVAAATITWLLRDGTSMAGRIVFAWYQGSSLDSDAKRWRLFADILNDAALCIELVSGLFPQYFTIIACTSALCKSIVGVAGGATRAALTMHQARRNNMADVSAKDGSQETLVNLFALLMGLVLTPLVAGNFVLTWAIFLFCTMLHLYANYRAVTCVVMETLNQTRLHLLVQDYLSSSQLGMAGPDSVNAREPVVWRLKRPLTVRLGAPFGSIVKTLTDLETCLQSNGQEHYLLRLDMKQGCVDIVIHHSSTSEDIIKACLQAEILMHVVYHQQSRRGGSLAAGTTDSLQNELAELLHRGVFTGREDCWSAVRVSRQICNRIFSRFLHELGQSGWVNSHTQLGADEWRATWNIDGINARKGF